MFTKSKLICALIKQLEEAPKEIFFLQRTLSTSAHISSLATGHAHLFASAGSGYGFIYLFPPWLINLSDDGTLRVYDLSGDNYLHATFL